MDKVKIIFGSTTGNTESAANQIAAAFGVEPVNIASASAADFDAELLILGSSTWGLGELQDDWAANIPLLENAELQGKKVAVFGMGDQNGFGDTYCDAMGILAEKAQTCGATLIGQTCGDGYTHSTSIACNDGTFCGLALDNDNEPEKTADRISTWTELLKKEMIG